MAIEQAMILAAGRGERMMPLSRDLPKPLLPIGDTTLIERHLKNLADAGARRVVINVCYLAEKITTVLGTKQFGMEVLYSRETELLETAGGIQAALPLLGDEPFLVVNGDIYTDYPFEKLLVQNIRTLPFLVMIPNPAHHPMGDFCLAEDGRLGLPEALANGGGLSDQALTFSGIGVYSAEFFRGVSAGNRMLRPLFEQAIAEQRLFGEYYDGFWSDVGTPERYAELKARVQ